MAPEKPSLAAGMFCIEEISAFYDTDTASLMQGGSRCSAAPADPAGPDAPAPAPPSRAEIQRVVESLAASLTVPAPTPVIGPDPSWNEWNMAVVGIPYWLSSDVPRNAVTSAVGGGIRIDIRARLDSIHFDMGDGKAVTCGVWTPYTRGRVEPETPSPTCGHVYSWPSLPKGSYTITATARWTATWSALGHTGTVPLRSTATREFPVGELQSVVIR